MTTIAPIENCTMKGLNLNDVYDFHDVGRESKENNEELLVSVNARFMVPILGHKVNGKRIRSKSEIEFGIVIEEHEDKLLPNVWNLSFGPVQYDPEEDTYTMTDHDQILHTNRTKLYSTVFLFAKLFLEEFPDLSLGIDGSDLLRTRVYHNLIKQNRDKLEEVFDLLGVDVFARYYYQRVKNKSSEHSLEIDRESELPGFIPWKDREGDIILVADFVPFDSTRQSRSELYYYYILSLKKEP